MKFKPIANVPPLVVESIEKFEQEMNESVKTQSNRAFLDECKRVYNKNKF